MVQLESNSTMVQCKKQPIVQLEPYPCVNSTVDHGTYKTQFPCETWQSAGTRHHQ